MVGKKMLLVLGRKKRRLMMVEPPCQTVVRTVLKIDDRIFVAIKLVAVESVPCPMHCRRVADHGIGVDDRAIKFGKDGCRRDTVKTVPVVKYPKFHSIHQ